MKSGDLWTNNEGMLWKFNPDLNLETVRKRKLIQIVKDRTLELIEERRLLQAVIAEKDALEAELSDKEAENNDLRENVKRLKAKVAVLRSLYHSTQCEK